MTAITRTFLTTALVISIAVGANHERMRAGKSAPAFTPNGPPRIDQPRAGADVITGHAIDARFVVRIRVFSGTGVLLQKSDSLVDPSDFTFAAAFKNPLASGQIVQATLVRWKTEIVPSAPVAVEPTVSLNEDRSPAAYAANGRTKVRIIPVNEPSPNKTSVAMESSNQDAGVGSNYTQVSGIDVSPAALVPSPQGANSTQGETNGDTAPPARDMTGIYDLGRVRYYFTSGVVLSNDHGYQLQSSGTQAGLFLGLNADRAWLSLTPPSCAKVKNPNPGVTCIDKDHEQTFAYRSFNVNTYFDARLTSVATQQEASSSTGTSGSAGGSSTALQSFSQSQKAASLQVGAYLPLDLRPWLNRANDSYSLFIAPLAKAGFTTLTDNPQAGAVSTSGGATTQVSTLPVTDRFYKSYSYGARFGVYEHEKIDDKHDAAPSTVGYVDVSVGKFGDFEAFRDLTAEQNLTTTNPHEFLRIRPWRYSFEGLLKLPKTPLVVGFNANIGMGAVGPGRDAAGLHPYTQPRDDLRFLLGGQFDFAKFLSAITRPQAAANTPDNSKASQTKSGSGDSQDAAASGGVNSVAAARKASANQ